jgi:HTH-type transcriptional regulator / antitoxin MqsA
MTKKRIHPETGAVLRRGVRVRKIDYMGVDGFFAIPGWWPADDGEGILDAPDLKFIDLAFDQLRAEAAEHPGPADVRHMRQLLKLSQRRADEILAGEPGAFRKYESGERIVSRPMANVLRLLERDPSRLKELIADRAA